MYFWTWQDIYYQKVEINWISGFTCFCLERGQEPFVFQNNSWILKGHLVAEPRWRNRFQVENFQQTEGWLPGLDCWVVFHPLNLGQLNYVFTSQHLALCVSRVSILEMTCCWICIHSLEVIQHSKCIDENYSTYFPTWNCRPNCLAWLA